MKKLLRNTHNFAGFTLVELLAIMCILAILAGIMIFPAYGLIERTRFDKEVDVTQKIAEEIKTSFRMDDLTKNISAINGSIPDTVTPTRFDYELLTEVGTDSTALTYDSWYSRLARARGETPPPDGTLLSNDSQVKGELRAIVFNAYGSRRLLLVGPANDKEVNREAQRYLLLSFMFSNKDAELAIPAPSSTDYTVSAADGDMTSYENWFNTLYEHNWGPTCSRPSGWGAEWDGKSPTGMTYAQRVIAVRIVQPRHRVTINNHNIKKKKTDGSDTYYVYGEALTLYSNFRTHSEKTSGKIKIDVASGDSSTTIPGFAAPGILEGRRVIITRWQPDDLGNRPSSLGAEKEIFSFLLNEPAAITTN
ncbi:MAG: hypothetical protein LBV12_06825 [Puniceicoccales bacterium]|jgi:type II secretory pathway pseudopilin PulG|nr:hypothetical protein [Puniceicoccales bacterium]